MFYLEIIFTANSLYEFDFKMSGPINKRMSDYFLQIMSIVLVTISCLILNNQIYDLFKPGTMEVIGYIVN